MNEIIEMVLELKKYTSRKEIASKLGVNVESISNWMFGTSNPSAHNEISIQELYKDIDRYKEDFYRARDINYKLGQYKRSKRK